MTSPGDNTGERPRPEAQRSAHETRIGAADALPALQARRTLQQSGQFDDVQLLDRALRNRSGPPLVVVVGEVKRGKSTLVNALAGSIVSPADVGIATTGTIAAVPPSASLPVGSAELVFAEHTEMMSAAEALQLLTPSDDWDSVAPLGARFAVDSRWVPGIALVDTPGVGGLDSAHGRRAKLAAADAAALLFVTDGGQPLTAPELRFLREVSEHTEHVVFALTKIDRNPGGWEQIRDENRSLLAQHAPRFSSPEIYPVTAAYAVHAWSQPDDVRARMEEVSGVPALAASLRGLAADEARLRLANALRVGHTGLRRLEAHVDLEIRAVTDTQLLGDLEAERARLAELLLQQRRSRLDLERDLGRVRAAAVRHIGERAEALTDRQAARIKGQRMAVSAATRNEFAAELDAELAILAEDVRRFTGERLSEVAISAFGSLDNVPETSGQFSAELHEVHTQVRSRPSVSMNPLLDPALAGTAFMGSRMAGFMATAVTGAVVLGPAALLLGAAGAGALVAMSAAHRSLRQGQQDLAGTLHETVSGAKQDLGAGVDTRIRELRPEIHIALEDFLKGSITSVRAVLDEAQRAARADESTRKSTLENLHRQQAAVRSRSDAIEGRLVELRRLGTK